MPVVRRDSQGPRGIAKAPEGQVQASSARCLPVPAATRHDYSLPPMLHLPRQQTPGHGDWRVETDVRSREHGGWVCMYEKVMVPDRHALWSHRRLRGHILDTGH